MIEQILNMNQLIQIELTNYGKEIYKKYYEAFYNGNAQVQFLNNSITLLLRN